MSLLALRYLPQYICTYLSVAIGPQISTVYMYLTCRYWPSDIYRSIYVPYLSDAIGPQISTAVYMYLTLVSLSTAVYMYLTLVSLLALRYLPQYICTLP